ncbi:MAG: hypothetical protein AAGG09_14905 [Pseudomonadota bacterium]
MPVFRNLLVAAMSVVVALAPVSPAASSPKKRLTTVADPTITNGIAVYRRAGSKPKDYWCNAGDYAARNLGAGSGSALELVRPEGAAGGPSDRQSIGFSVVAGRGDSGSVTVDRVGERHSIAQTKAFCQSQRGGRDD